MTEISLSVTMDSGNAAFDDAPETEIARILGELAADIRKGRSGRFVLMDHNGNRVGTATLSIDDEGGAA